jgi:ribosomal protein L13
MLPYKQPKGKQAYKRLKVFIGTPENLKNQKTETLDRGASSKAKMPLLYD